MYDEILRDYTQIIYLKFQQNGINNNETVF